MLNTYYTLPKLAYFCNEPIAPRKQHRWHTVRDLTSEEKGFVTSSVFVRGLFACRITRQADFHDVLRSDLPLEMNK